MNEDEARARMALIQWKALEVRLPSMDCFDELLTLSRFSTFKKSKVCDDGKLRQYLVNGWTTEALLVQNLNAFDGDALRNSLVWAFPQAYYSAFGVALAYFQASGFSEGKTHASLIRKVGDEMHLGHYPMRMSFLVSGGSEKERTFKNLNRKALPSSLFFDPHDDEVVDTQIARALNATRHQDLRDRLSDRKLKTKTGRARNRFLPEEYETSAKNLGHTSVFSFLYRKRIKSNYEDIDSIISLHLSADEIFGAIISVLTTLNLVHEAYIARALGLSDFRSFLEGTKSEISKRPKARFKLIEPHLDWAS